MVNSRENQIRGKVSYTQSKALHVVAKLNEEQESFEIICKDKDNINIIDVLNSFDGIIKENVKIIEKPVEEVEEAIALEYDYETTLTEFITKLEREDGNDGLVVDLLNFIIERAIIDSASDIHFEPEQDFLRIRYRIDGILQEKAKLPLWLWERVNIRIKVLSNMSIAEHRKCFSGKMVYDFCDRKIDIRVSTQPVNWGENIVCRILDTKQKHINFADIGLDQESDKYFKRAFNKSSGLFLISGPTGSGKTTTLYSMLKEINSVEKSIVTLEDPIEYNIPMIRQTQVDYFGNVSFAEGIRSILRQDPDVILIGEIRDEESAKIAMRAAMTGHLVFSSVHAKDSASIITRLNDFGISTNSIKENVVALASQRLARSLCDNCKAVRKINDNEREIFERYNITPPDIVGEISPSGCAKCHNTGFKGRSLIAEIILLQEGLQTNMQENALRLIKEQKTTFKEVSRVLDL